jgi:hypothetical protein
MKIGNKIYSKAELQKRIGNLGQIGGVRHYELLEGSNKGTRAIDVNTGSGFNFTILPDRGMDISRASYKGMNLVYQTPNGEVNPAFYQSQGSEWLRTFFAGLLTTCGLTYLGPPGKDGDDDLGLHGRYSASPARQVCDLSRWEKDEYRIELSGHLEESILFGSKIRLNRTIMSQIGLKSLYIEDIVENYGSTDSPFTILYHINIGFPVLDKNSKLVVSSNKIFSYDELSKSGIIKFNQFSEPIANYQEQNFFHEMLGDKEGYAYAALINTEIENGIGVYIKFAIANLPYLSEWKMMGEVDYVVALEPCNTKCKNRGDLRREGILPMIEPGESKKTEVEIGVLVGEKEISDFVSKIDAIKKN